MITSVQRISNKSPSLFPLPPLLHFLDFLFLPLLHLSVPCSTKSVFFYFQALFFFPIISIHLLYSPFHAYFSITFFPPFFRIPISLFYTYSVHLIRSSLYNYSSIKFPSFYSSLSTLSLHHLSFTLFLPPSSFSSQTRDLARNSR